MGFGNLYPSRLRYLGMGFVFCLTLAFTVGPVWAGGHKNEENLVPDAFLKYLRENLPPPAEHCIYFDFGTETLDGLYEPHQLRVDQIMIGKGYDRSNWQTLKFEGEEHSETAWQKRLHIPLKFLLAP